MMDSSRALEEKNKELDGLRRQLAREEEEKHELFAQINALIGEMAQIKQAANGGSSVTENNNELVTLQSELDELKLDFGRKQGEFQRVCGELNREREENRRRENMMQLEGRRMQEELRERDELLKELTETSDELGRALNEANNELQSTRDQFAASQHEFLQKQQKSEGPVLPISDNSLIKQLHFEIDELKINLKSGEQQILEKDTFLSQKSDELKRAEDKIVLLEKRIETSNQKAEDFEQRFSLIAVNNTELKSQLKATELALETDKSKNLVFLEKMKKDAELEAKLAFEESEEKINKATNENTQLSALLLAEQKRFDSLKEQLFELKKENDRLENCLSDQKKKENTINYYEEELIRLKEINNRVNSEQQTKINQLEEENTRLVSELVVIEKKAERDIQQQNNAFETLKIELENLKEENNRKKPFESPPTAKPRKTLNGNNNSSNETSFDDIGEIMTIKAELEKQRRLVTVLRKKLQQQQLDALKQQKQ